MLPAPFNIEWVFQFLTAGNFTLSGVRSHQGSSSHNLAVEELMILVHAGATNSDEEKLGAQ
jgi:hypothetical protein